MIEMIEQRRERTGGLRMRSEVDGGCCEDLSSTHTTSTTRRSGYLSSSSPFFRRFL
jgi:hypothetical protein